ncbi:MAG: class I lanthipeptide [Kordia sp.]|uniref:class I lanthipeptide n=1 Tax=Kordia sp. TaxID=1965332 RepID=UPI00385A968B
MKKRKLNSLSLKKQRISSLNESIIGGANKTDVFTVTCARPIGNCTIALTVQPLVCALYSLQYDCNTLEKC